MYVPLSFKNVLIVDALLNWGACISAVAHIELHRINQQASAIIFKIDDPPAFQTQVADGELNKQ